MSLPRNLGKNVFSQGKTHPQDLALLSEGINEKKNVGCHISKQRMLQPSSLYSHSGQWALRGLRMETNGLPIAKPSAPAATPSGAPWGGSGWESTGYGPRSLRCPSKGWFQWAQTLVSSRTQKSAEFLNSRCLVFFNSNLLMLCLPHLCCKNSYIPWLPPCLFGAAPPSYMRCCGRA